MNRTVHPEICKGLMPEPERNIDGGAAPVLPTAEDIRRAVDLYVHHAHGGTAPSLVADLVPPEAFDPRQWLGGSTVEPMPPDVPFERVRSFALRLGNSRYPHMKLRISRAPQESGYLFSVDCHDAFLTAPAGSPDHEPLEALKRHNADLAAAIIAEWESAGLPTERTYLRRRVSQARGAPEAEPNG